MITYYINDAIKRKCYIGGRSSIKSNYGNDDVGWHIMINCRLILIHQNGGKT